MGEYRLKHYLLDYEGEVIWTYDVFLWAEWMEGHSRRVAETDVGPYWVSTVFMGTDYDHRQRGPPILWETMVFGPNGAWTDHYQTRATSLQHARLQHRIGCWRARRMLH